MNRLGKNVLYIVARSHWFNIKCVEDYANVKVNRMIWERVEGKPTERKHSVTERHNIDWGTVSPDVKEQIRELSRRAQELLSSARDDESAVVDITPTDGHAL